ncbi:hypothetical protein FOZ63_025712, partial [Perkinsus olseni]
MTIKLLTWFGLSSTLTSVTVCGRIAAPRLQALAGLYRTIDTVSVFEGIAIRLTPEKRCAVIFLAGTPRQDFQSSIRTGFVNTKETTTPAGLKCYHLLWSGSESSFSRAKALKEMFGSPGNFSLGSIIPCFSEKGYMVLVDGSGHAMQKLSSDPVERVDLPLEPPPPAVYVNDEPAPHLGNKQRQLELLGGISKFANRARRCFGLIFSGPERSLTGGLPSGHPLKKLKWGPVRVRLKLDTLSGVYRTNYPISVFEGVA